MAKIRKFCAYRRTKRPYTRISKFRKKSYIRTNPNLKITKFEMGSPSKKFQYTVNLLSKSRLQIRDNALESARQTANKLLEANAGLNGFFLKVRAYPSQILRENPLASGAGADRFSTGMQKAFGKPIGNAAVMKKGKVIIEVRVNKDDLIFAKKALKRSICKLPCAGLIDVKEN